jgi:hypothetical protein
MLPADGIHRSSLTGSDDPNYEKLVVGRQNGKPDCVIGEELWRWVS